jgi:GT2 family glycosyltransferase
MNLVILSGFQDILDKCIPSLLPTIEGKPIKVYLVTEGLKFPDHPQLIRVDRTEFNPPKYFEIVKNMVPPEERQYFGVVNDDILFHPLWADQVLKLLETYDCVSPGYVEYPDWGFAQELLGEVTPTSGYEAFQGQFMACYIFRWEVFEKVGMYDETLEDFWDIDWYWRVLCAGYKWMTGKKITIAHIGHVARTRDGSVRSPRMRANRIKFYDRLQARGGPGWCSLKKSFKRDLQRTSELHY